MTSERQWRATFEDTKSNQETLREKIDELIQEQRPIKDEQERKDLIELISNSTIGLGTDPIKIRLYEKKKVVDIPNFEQFFYELLYVQDKKLDGCFFWFLTGENIDGDVPIEYVWLNVRRCLFAVYPFAKANTLKLSKEREHYDFGGEGGFRIGKKTKSEDS